MKTWAAVCWVSAVVVASAMGADRDRYAVNIELKSSATVRNRSITVADVAVITGGDSKVRERLSLLELAEVPASGQTLVIKAKQIEYRLILADFPRQLFSISGAGEAIVGGARDPISVETIQNAAREALLRRLPWPAEDLSIALVRPISLQMPQAAEWESPTFKAEPHSPSVGMGRTQIDISIFVNGERKLSLPVYFDVNLLQKVAISKTPFQFHHHPHQLPSDIPHHFGRVHLLDFSSRLANLETTYKHSQALEEILRLGRERFHLDRPDLEEFLGTVRPKIEAFAEVIQVDIGACPRFAEILAVGCEELVRLSVNRAQQVESAASSSQGFARSNGSDLGQTQAVSVSLDPATVYSLDFLEKLEQSNQTIRLQNYEIQGIIGKGGMGVVLKALDTSLDRLVALKMLNADLANSATARRRFAREARSAARIHHENAVTIYSVSEWQGVSFLVMEYVQSKSIHEWIESGRRFTPPEIARIGRECALGLAAAHQMRLIHRDIKPGNLLLERDSERVRITDFGLARATDDQSQVSHDGGVVGTPLFMSPEQVEGKQLNHLTDLFSLGSVLYALCTGKLPFSEQGLMETLEAVLHKSPAPVREVNASIPENLASIVERLMAKDSRDRVPSASKLAELFRGIAGAGTA